MDGPGADPVSHERRRHPRYLVRLPIRLHRGNEELRASIVNASAGGCLLQLAIPLEPGEVLEVSIPELKMPRVLLIVLRCESAPHGYMVATRFDELMADEASLRQLAGEQQNASKSQLLH